MKNTKGITLVALVITIIVLLILSGISIQALTQTNLFEKTKEAKNAMENSQNKENETLSSYVEKIDDYLQNENDNEKILVDQVSAGEIAIGSYINYVPDEVTDNDEKYKTLISNLAEYSGNPFEDENNTEKIKQETKLKWRVLDVKDGQVRLISATPTTAEVYLDNYSGYNNGVKLIDDICNTLYNNSKLTSKVQNLKIEDIQNKVKDEEYTNLDKNYGSIFIHESENKYYPSIILKEKGQEVIVGNQTTKGNELKQSEQNEYIKQDKANEADTLKVKYTYWNKDIVKEDFLNSTYYDIFVNDGSYNWDSWISSRCIDGDSNYAQFSIYRISSGSIAADYIYRSDGDNCSNSDCCRPVISLKSNVKIDKSNSGDGKENTPYYIK